MKLQDAVVVITGANRGLGRALVEASLAAGARRVYAGARVPDQLAGVVALAPARIVPLALDVTEPASLAAAAARAEDATVLINNAGVLASYSVLTSSPEAIAQDFATNLFGLLAATRAFVPALERARPGALVNILSVASLASLPALGGYAAAKAAAWSVTQALRGELAPRGVAVHGVLAGSIDTDMVRHMEMAKTSPADVARGVIAGVEAGDDDIAPDPMARELVALWRSDPKAIERRLAAM